MKQLNESDVLRLMREEYALVLEKAKTELDMFFKMKGDESEDLVISPELKVKHKKSGLNYTVDSVSLKDVILRAPEGDTFVVNKDEFENDYVLE